MENPEFKNIEDKYETQTLKDADSDADLIVENLRGFDLQAEFKNLEGPAVEIAGPTAKGYAFNMAGKDGNFESVDLLQKAGEKSKVYISNIFTGTPYFVGGKAKLKGKVDFVADSQNMPIKDGEASAVFCSHLGRIDAYGIESMQKDKSIFVPKNELNRLQSYKDDGSPESDSNEEENPLIEKTIMEAWRMLGENGFLVWQGGGGEDINTAKEIGFLPVHLEKVCYESDGEPHYRYKAIFKKVVK